MSKDYNLEIKESIENFLIEDDWHYNFDDDRGVFRFGVNLHKKLKSVQVVILVNEHDYSVYAISPISVEHDDPEQMSRMAEFVCRANYGLKDGNFELDFTDGELRYKSYVFCEDDAPSKARVKKSISCPASMFDRYANGILQIVAGSMSPEAAVSMCEEDVRTARPAEDDDDDEGDMASALRRLLQRLHDDDDDADDDDDDADDEDAAEDDDVDEDDAD